MYGKVSDITGQIYYDCTLWVTQEKDAQFGSFYNNENYYYFYWQQDDSGI